jgi:Ser/Thr protein kinase RdoA (MazF antagonist)
MTEQSTDPETIESEILTVRRVAGLNKDVEVKFVDDGWDSRVYMFDYGDGRAVMKFPRSEKIRGRYASQIAALHAAAQIAGRIDVPTVLWRHRDDEYFGYQAIEGQRLATALRTMDIPAKLKVGRALGEFLARFHDSRLHDVRDLRPNQEIKQVQDWYGKGAIEESGLLTDDELKSLRRLVFTDWPQQLVIFKEVLKICHGDFHFGNMFYNDGRLGIIDFGDICLADYTKDFTDLNDAAIFEAATKRYASIVGDYGDQMLQKIALRRDMVRVITLTAQVIKGEDELARRTAAELKATLG